MVGLVMRVPVVHELMSHRVTISGAAPLVPALKHSSRTKGRQKPELLHP